ncbi:MAG: ABC transporter ATP-binding protein [Candidatus Eisenbacteria bacterium]|nr:ABC transporter ATP-binding protein [Candidatus Eisenbacteria bacterium]
MREIALVKERGGRTLLPLSSFPGLQRPAGESEPQVRAEAAVKVEGIGKCFKSPFLRTRKWAVRSVSLEVRSGEIFGLLGPNGAGKTTTLKLLSGLILPTEGTGSILGKPIGDPEARRELGFLPENPSFYERITVDAVLKFAARLAGVSKKGTNARVRQLISLLRLDEWARTEARKLSKGTLQKLGIAQAIVGSPKLLILDEPMSSLDPIGRREVRELLLSMKESGVTILFSTHILPDVEALCDRVGIMKEGRISRILNLNETARNSESYEILIRHPRHVVVEKLSKISEETRPSREGIAAVLDSNQALKRALMIVLEEDAELLAVSRKGEKLEESFIREVTEV